MFIEILGKVSYPVVEGEAFKNLPIRNYIVNVDRIAYIVEIPEEEQFKLGYSLRIHTMMEVFYIQESKKDIMSKLPMSPFYYTDDFEEEVL